MPGLWDLHRMCGLLLAERVPADGRVLVLGAGGGLELKAFAEQQPGWSFHGVDPSPSMLQQAKETLGDQAERVAFCEGYIDDAPEGPFDGAACLLTLHFLPAVERQRTLAEIHRRLKPGAPLVVVHHSFPTDEVGKDRWLARYAAFSGAASVSAMKERLPVLSPPEDAALLAAAGFTGVELFYAAFTFKGWVGYKG